MERIRVKMTTRVREGQLGHIVAYRGAADALVVLDTGEIFLTNIFNVLAVDNSWQTKPPPGGYVGTATAGGYVGTIEAPPGPKDGA